MSDTQNVERDAQPTTGPVLDRPAALTVWYNTKCPICDAGINRQRARLMDSVRAGRIAFRDINAEPDALTGVGATLADVRRRLYATTSDGTVLVGADVATAIWRLTPGEEWLAAVFGNRVARPLTRFGYNRFADLLYAWNRQAGRW